MNDLDLRLEVVLTIKVMSTSTNASHSPLNISETVRYGGCNFQRITNRKWSTRNQMLKSNGYWPVTSR